jgi:orotidine-5'-phosphate decarboxylase
LSFKYDIAQRARNTKSKVVLALDLPPSDSETVALKAREILEVAHPHICAVKFNRHLILPLGLFDRVQKLVSQAKSYGLPTIMDCKINDIGNTNRVIAEYYFKAGCDAVTANPFVGWEEGLQPVFETARHMERGVILLVYMSHRAAWEGYGQTTFNEHTQQTLPQYRLFAQKALKWNADGAVVGATHPEKIKELHGILGEQVPIYSPGIGVQGGTVKTAIRAGAEYLIVGRAITLADDPAEAAQNLKLAAQKT